MNSSRTLLVYSIALILFFIVYGFGCGSDGKPTACVSDDECAAYEACMDGVCTETECKSDINCPGGERCVDYKCSQFADECDLRISPEGPINFGEVDIGLSEILDVRIHNVGESECLVSIIEIRKSEESLGDFFILTSTMSAVLAPKVDFKVRIAFRPTQEGKHLATVWVTSDDPDMLIGSNEIECSSPEPLVEGQACIMLNGRTL